MAEHNTLTGSSLHEPKGVDVATSNQVYVSNGSGSGTWTTAASVSSSVIPVFAIADFGDVVGGAIQLAANTKYILRESVSTDVRFIGGVNTVIAGEDDYIVALEYTGTGTMFTGVDVTTKFIQIGLTAPNGTMFDYEDTAGNEGINSIWITNSSIYATATIGRLKNQGALFINASSVSGITVDGFTIEGSLFGDIDINWTDMGMVAGTFLDLGTSVCTSVGINSYIADIPAGTTFLSGAVNSANIDANGEGTLTNGKFKSSAGTLLSGITEDDDRWDSKHNDRIRNTVRDALISVQGNTTVSGIVALNTPVKMVATFAESRSSGFSTDASGTIEQLLVKGELATITVSISGRMGSSNDKDCTFYLAVGTGTLTASDIISESGVEVSLHSTKTYSTTLVWQTVLTQGMKVELWGEQNESVLDDIILRACSFRIN